MPAGACGRAGAPGLLGLALLATACGDEAVFDPRVKSHLVQMGQGRRASTFHWYLLCRAWQLKHGNVVCQYSVNWKAAMRRAAHRGNVVVLKGHAMVTAATAVAVNATVPRPGVFYSYDSVAWYEEKIVPARLGRPVRTMRFTDLVTHGWRRVAEDHALVLGLDLRQRELLTEHLRYWVVLRRCCGMQLSADFRTILRARHTRPVAEPERLRGLKHRWGTPLFTDCILYNLTEVERLYRKTYVSLRYGSSVESPVGATVFLRPHYCTTTTALAARGAKFNELDYGLFVTGAGPKVTGSAAPASAAGGPVLSAGQLPAANRTEPRRTSVAR